MENQQEQLRYINDRHGEQGIEPRPQAPQRGQNHRNYGRHEDEDDRPIGDYAAPTLEGYGSPIILADPDALDFEPKSALINMVSKDSYCGRGSATQHLSTFQEYCRTFKPRSVQIENVYLKLFPTSLDGDALDWFHSQDPGTFTSWRELATAFLAKFYPPSRTKGFIDEIMSFSQKENESFHAAYDRFKKYQRECPHHNIRRGDLVRYFYMGMSRTAKTQMDAASGGALMGLSASRATDIIEKMATNSAQYIGDDSRRLLKGRVDPRADSPTDSSNYATKEQFSSLEKKLDTMIGMVSARESNKPRQVGRENYENQNQGHWGFNKQGPSSNSNQGNTQNQNQRSIQQGSHMHEQGSSSQSQVPPSQGNALMEMMKDIVRRLERVEVSQRADKGPEKLPAQPDRDPREHCNAIFVESDFSLGKGTWIKNCLFEEDEIEREAPIEEVKGITLKSGKVLPSPQMVPEEVDAQKEIEPLKKVVEADISKEVEEEKVEEPPLMRRYVTRVPFPQQLKKHSKVDKEWGKFLKVMKQLTVTVPFMDLVRNAPMYGKFVKEILSNKRTIEEVDSCVLSHDCSALLTKTVTTKARDPGQFTIPCSIGDTFFDQPLADLGASVSVMSLSVYRKLGLEGMKSTGMVLHLADGTSKRPHGLIENVPVKVDRFYIPCDFVVLDAKENANSRLILGRPFLATAKANIEVATGKLTLEICDEIVEIEPRAQVEVVTGSRDKVPLEEVSLISEETPPKAKKLTKRRLRKLCDPSPSLSFGEQFIESFCKISLRPSKIIDPEKKGHGNSSNSKPSSTIASKAPD